MLNQIVVANPLIPTRLSNILLNESPQSNVNKTSFTILDCHSEIYNKILSSFINYLKIKTGRKKYVIITIDNSLYTLLSVNACWLLNKVPVLIEPTLTNQEFNKIHKASRVNEIINDNSLFEIDFSITLKKIEKNSLSKFNKKNKNDALVIYSSGSTGEPKGVVHSFKSLYSSFEIADKYFSFSEDDLWILSLSPYHIGGFSIYLRAMLSGASLLIPEGYSAKSLSICYQKFKPNYFSLVSKQLKDFIQLENKSHKNLKAILLGGGKSNKEIVKTALERNFPIYKVYGSTETAAFVAIQNPVETKKNLFSSGKPLQSVKLKIIDNELYVSSPSLFRKYLNQRIKKSELKNNFFRTGDIAEINKNGFVTIHSRQDDIIISGGKNISISEIEETILKFPGIDDVCVVGIESKEWGEIVSAAIEIKSRKSFSIKKFKEFVKLNLSSYKIPKYILTVNELPKSSLNKVKREDVKEMILSQLLKNSD